ncbi:hypothetical protein GMORB2_7505 [Geosmithia morbida]|uniref:Uncharacterized protein n=1 Tax=Geosmithia morbida TaxID=1094350 RepID=A0A9P4YSW9_9HYPO|nr:uncharacterized protein GMORB2_7505 [Geosmithia morbida]KAF4122513.1 hypothetical protein GMORB2_7505 [Geosmithia morbida]
MQRFLQCSELILRVAELSDLQTISALMEVRDLGRLIETHRRSILREKHRSYSYPLPAGCASPSALLIYQLTFSGPSKGLACYAKIHSAGDWGSLKVVEWRRIEVERLLDAPYLRLRPGPAASDFTWPRLDASGRSGLRAMLRRALYMCDTLHDMEAKAFVDMDMPVNRWRNRRARDVLPEGGPAFAAQYRSLTGNSVGLRRMLVKEMVAVTARRHQVAMLQSLPDDDLIGLFMLCRVATESWRENHMTPRHDAAGQPLTLFEQEVSFKETILRFGSWSLYAEVRDFGPRATHRRWLLKKTQADVVDADPQACLRAESSLIATLNSELVRRLNTSIQSIERKVFPIAEAMIGARSPAFEKAKRQSI